MSGNRAAHSWRSRGGKSCGKRARFEHSRCAPCHGLPRVHDAEYTTRKSSGKFVLSTPVLLWSRVCVCARDESRSGVDHRLVTMKSGRMVGRQSERLTDAALHAFFDGLFPDAFAGADVLTEIAPKGWEQNLMFACFNPIDRTGIRRAGAATSQRRSVPKSRCRRDSSTECDDTRSSQPTLQFWTHVRRASAPCRRSRTRARSRLEEASPMRKASV
jgi:hypothetical protein